MKAKQRTEIKIQTLERTVIRLGQGGPTIFCRACQTSTRHFSIAQAVSIFGLSEHTITRLADCGEIHSTENAEGPELLCGDSLATHAKE